MLLTKPSLVISAVTVNASNKGKGLFVVRHGSFNNSAISAYGNGIRLPARQDQFLTKKAAEKNIAEHTEPMTARFYQTKPQLFIYSAEEVAAAVAKASL